MNDKGVELEEAIFAKMATSTMNEVAAWRSGNCEKIERVREKKHGAN
jgi:hypothetical protein